MNKIKAFFKGIGREAKRVRWPKGKRLVSLIGSFFVYAVFFGLFLMACDFLVIQLLNGIGV